MKSTFLRYRLISVGGAAIALRAKNMAANGC